MLQAAAVFAGKVYRKLTFHKPIEKIPESAYGKPILTPQEGNDWIREQLQGNKPFVAARYGSVEIAFFAEYIKWIKYQEKGVIQKLYANIKEDRRKKFTHSATSSLKQNAGFFSIHSEELLLRYINLLIEDSKSIDFLGTWQNPYENIVVKEYNSKEVSLGKLRSLEPYYHDSPWSSALSGKKVLIIHPFVKSIQAQYEHREKLFPNTEILPEFELRTIPAVQSIAGNAPAEFSTWFDALDHMKGKMEATDFDVLIVGAGAYGFHLATHAKRIGKQAVLMGGATQLLFGIKGQRWDDHPLGEKLYNEAWVRPLPEEIPRDHTDVEEGCYW